MHNRNRLIAGGFSNGAATPAHHRNKQRNRDLTPPVHNHPTNRRTKKDGGKRKKGRKKAGETKAGLSNGREICRGGLERKSREDDEYGMWKVESKQGENKLS